MSTTKNKPSSSSKPKGNRVPRSSGAPKPPTAPKEPKAAAIPKVKPLTKDEALGEAADRLSTPVETLRNYRPANEAEQKEIDALLAANRLPVSKMADLMPRLSEDGLQGLAADIASRGQMNPILLLRVKTANGSVAYILTDGRNRLAATQIAKVKPIFYVQEVDEKESGQVQFRDTISLNLIRRQLSASQNACIGADLFEILGPKLQKELAERRRQAAKEAGQPIDSTTEEKDASSYADSVREIIAGILSGLQPAQVKEGAKPVVSGRYIDMARDLKRGAPDLFEQVKAGELVLKKAVQELKLRDNPQLQNDKNAPEGASSKGEVSPEFLSAESIAATIEKAKQGKVVMDRAKLAGILAHLQYYIGKYGYESPVAATTPDGEGGGPEEE